MIVYAHLFLYTSILDMPEPTYTHSNCQPLHFCPGELAKEHFPNLEARIEQVQAHGSFEILDLFWIARAVQGSIRLTIDQKAFETTRQFYPWLPQDGLIGDDGADVVAHLYFSWQTSVEDASHVFGHYDVLIPCSEGDASLSLPKDAT